MSGTVGRFCRGLGALFLSFHFNAFAVDFDLGWALDAGGNSFCVTLVDIDGDGDLDAYVCDTESPDRLYLNDGSGVFTRSSQILDASPNQAAAFGLFNADAYPDLFLVRDSNDNRVWTNDANGILTDTGQSLGASLSKRGLALGLLDANSTLDAFVPTNSALTGSKIYFSNASGVFTDSGQDIGDSASTSVVLVDVGEDMNGDIDAIVGNNGFNKVWFNDGTGTFTDSGEDVGASESTFGLAVGLIDGDAVLDIFVANGSNEGDPNEVLFGDGDGTFSDSGQVLGNEYSFSVALHDFDNQNGPDAFVGNNSGIMDRLWVNDGSGTFSDSGQTLGVGAAIDVEAGLINNDPHLDVFVANGNQPDQIWLGDGAGNFTDSGQLIGSGSGFSVDLADFDGDTHLDAVVGHLGGIVRVFFNDGSGNFTDSGQWLTHGLGNNNFDVAVGDFDGINGPDIFVANTPRSSTGDRANRIWLNDGSGVFTDSGQTVSTESTPAVAVGNVDGDSDLDILLGNAPYTSLTGANALFLNNAGTMTDSGQVFGDGVTTAVALVDVDGDTDLDAFFGNSGSGNWVYLNGEGSDPLGTFSDTLQSLGTNNTQAVAFGLLNNDMHIDMVEGNLGFNKVWFGDGAGNFADSGQSLGGVSTDTKEVHLFDFDDDGDLDLWVTNGSSTGLDNEVYLNGEGGDPLGTFSDSGLSLGDADHQRSAMGLLDGDDLPDIFVVTSTGDHHVWINDSELRQIVTPSPLAQEAAVTDPVSIDVSYEVSDDNESLSGLGLRLHWDSSELTFVNLTSVWAGDLMSEDTTCQADGSDFDSDAATDCYVGVVWNDAGDDWPGTGNTPTTLYTANFTSNVAVGDTTHINFSANTAIDYVLEATSASVTNPPPPAPEYSSIPPANTPREFGDVPVLTTSAGQVVFAENLGNADLTLSCALSGPDAGEYDVSACPTPVVPEDFSVIAVVCEPTTVGLKNASLDVTTNDPDELLVSYPLTCTGTGGEPEFDPTPGADTTLPFGSVPVLTTSAAKMVQVDNPGSTDLTLSCALSGANADEYDITACPTPVAPVGVTQISVVCEPTTEGPKSASLDVTTNDGDEPFVSFPLTCTGTGTPEFDSSPGANTPLAFGDVPVLTTSPAMPVDVDNLGTGNLLLDCSLSGTDASEFDVTACSSPVSPAGSTQISVVCEPFTAGAKNASLDVRTNDSDEPNVSYPLTCNGTVTGDPEFDAMPTQGTPLEFGEVTVSTISTPQAIEVENSGTANLLLNCNIVGPDADQFVLDECHSPIEPAVTVELSITCEPTSTGLKQGQLNVQTNDDDESAVSWMLECTGVEASETLIEHGFENQ